MMKVLHTVAASYGASAAITSGASVEEIRQKLPEIKLPKKSKI